MEPFLWQILSSGTFLVRGVETLLSEPFEKSGNEKWGKGLAGLPGEEEGREVPAAESAFLACCISQLDLAEVLYD